MVSSHALTRAQVLDYWTEYNKYMTSSVPQQPNSGPYGRGTFLSICKEGERLGLQSEIAQWYQAAIGHWVLNYKKLTSEILSHCCNLPQEVIVREPTPDNQWQAPLKVIPFHGAGAWFTAQVSRLDSLPLPDRCEALCDLAIEMGVCVVCKKMLMYHVGAGPLKAWKGMWFQYNQDSLDNMASWVETADYPTAFARLLGLCGVTTKNCVATCRACGNFPTMSFDIGEIKGWAQEGLCLKCSIKGLLQLSPPKLDKRGLRDYAHRFRNLKK